MYNPEIVIIYFSRDITSIFHIIFCNADKLFVMQFYHMGWFFRFKMGCEMNRVLIPLCLVYVPRLNDCLTAWEPNEIQIH